METMAVFGCYANTLEKLSFNTQQSVDSQGFQVMVVGSVALGWSDWGSREEM